MNEKVEFDAIETIFSRGQDRGKNRRRAGDRT